MKRNDRLVEALTFNDRPSQVDREGGVIRGVKLLGEESANAPPHNHVYPRATREKALGLFRDARVCLNHPTRAQSGETRPYQDGLGVVKDPREEGDGVYGDFHFNPEHPLASQICWDAEHAPQHLGFSINGDGDKRRDGGRTVVEAITGLSSIDLVSRPATTNGLFESRRRTVKKKVRDLIEALKTKRPGYSRALREMADAGIMSDAMEMEAPPDEAPAGVDEAGDHEATFVDGVKAAIGQVLDDEGMSWDEKIKQINAYLKTAKKHTDGGETTAPVEEAEEEDEPDGDEVEESKKRPKAKGRKGKDTSLTESALAQLAGKQVTLTPTVLLAVKGCRTAADVTSLVESLSAAPARERPGAKSATPQKEHSPSALKEGKAAAPPEDTPEARARRVSEARRAR